MHALPTFGPLTTRSGLLPNNFGARDWIPYRTESDLQLLWSAKITRGAPSANVRITIHVIEECCTRAAGENYLAYFQADSLSLALNPSAGEPFVHELYSQADLRVCVGGNGVVDEEPVPDWSSAGADRMT